MFFILEEAIHLEDFSVLKIAFQLETVLLLCGGLSTLYSLNDLIEKNQSLVLVSFSLPPKYYYLIFDTLHAAGALLGNWKKCV